MYRIKLILTLLLIFSGLSLDSLAESHTEKCTVEPFAVEKGKNQFQYDSFSADGKWIAIGWNIGKEEQGTYLLNMENGEKIDIPEFNNGATFSPDGEYLINSVYVENGKTDILQYHLASKTSEILAEHEAWDWLASYSPEGQKVLFNSFRTGNSDIYLLDLKTQKLEQITDTERYEAHGQFSPDGRYILYHQNVEGGDFNILLYDVKTQKSRALTESEREESYGSWSPDGQYIAFASDKFHDPGVADIFIMSKDGEVLRQITHIDSADGYPFWSPDGSYLYFTSYREPQGVYRVKMNNLIDCVR